MDTPSGRLGCVVDFSARTEFYGLMASCPFHFLPYQRLYRTEIGTILHTIPSS